MEKECQGLAGELLAVKVQTAGVEVDIAKAESLASAHQNDVESHTSEIDILNRLIESHKSRIASLNSETAGLKSDLVKSVETLKARQGDFEESMEKVRNCEERSDELGMR